MRRKGREKESNRKDGGDARMKRRKIIEKRFIISYYPPVNKIKESKQSAGRGQ